MHSRASLATDEGGTNLPTQSAIHRSHDGTSICNSRFQNSVRIGSLSVNAAIIAIQALDLIDPSRPFLHSEAPTGNALIGCFTCCSRSRRPRTIVHVAI